MTTTEAARLARCTVKAIQAACQRGNLKATKHGRDWWIEPKDFDAWMSSPRKVGRPSNSGEPSRHHRLLE